MKNPKIIAKKITGRMLPALISLKILSGTMWIIWSMKDVWLLPTVERSTFSGIGRLAPTPGLMMFTSTRPIAIAMAVVPR